MGLLVRGVEEVGEGAARVHRHVLPAVRLRGARAGAGLLGGIKIGTLQRVSHHLANLGWVDLDL